MARRFSNPSASIARSFTGSSRSTYNNNRMLASDETHGQNCMVCKEYDWNIPKNWVDWTCRDCNDRAFLAKRRG